VFRSQNNPCVSSYICRHVRERLKEIYWRSFRDLSKSFASQIATSLGLGGFVQSLKRAEEFWAEDGAGLGDDDFNGRGIQRGKITPDGEIRR